MRREAGFSMIEVLVTIAILVVGLLGLAALQSNTTIAELEAYQRSQGLVLVQDMADRISANKANAAAYVQNDIGLVQNDCTGLTGSQLDLCEWGNRLFGSAEVSAGGRNLGAMMGARGCITSPSPNVYMITVAWQGMTKAGAPAIACGQGQYGDDRNRRALSTVVRVPTLGS